jgi:ABC-type sugar transport system substrate-binding protein
MIVLVPHNVEECTEWVKSIYKAQIPVIVSNQLPNLEGFPYVLSATGPDDWGQARLLGREFVNLLEGEGGYCVISIMPGSSVYYARAFGVETEVKKLAPDMTCLGIFNDGHDIGMTKETVKNWIGRHGDSIRGMVLGDDNVLLQAVIEAYDEMGARLPFLAAFGNSETGMQAVLEGKLAVETYQSAETDGALPVAMAIDYFNGLAVEEIKYLPTGIINKANVNDYLPAQW